MNKIKVISLILCFAMTVGVFSACTVNRFLVLVENAASDYVIVISENGGAPAQNAASELSAYIEKISGTKLQIVTDLQPESQKEIVLGRTNRGDFDIDYDALGDDGYSIFVKDKKLVIGGGIRGAIYGVYGFLRDVLGCGFYGADSECVPTLQTVKVDLSVHITSVPRFKERTCYWSFYDNASDAERMKLGMSPQSADWGAKNLVYASVVPVMHNINNYVAGEESWFLHTYNKQPCVSSEENYGKILTTALSWIGRHEHCDAINVTQNDGPGGWCTCDRCTELNNLYGYGLPSGSWWYFINRLANDIHAVYPDVEIRTYAYEDTRTPVTLDIADGVSIYVAMNNGSNCVLHGLEKCPKNENPEFVQIMADWSDKVDNVYVFEYLGCPSEFNMTNPNWYAMLDNFKLFGDSAAQSVVCFGTDEIAADFVALRYYLMCRLTWNPYYTEDEYDALILDFCENYYGQESGKLIKDYINLVMDYFNDRHISIDYGYDIVEQYSYKDRDELYYPEVTDEMRADPDFNWNSLIRTTNFVDPAYIDGANALFEQAKSLAEDDTKLERIELAQIQVQYYELYIFDRVASSQTAWMKRMNQIIGDPVYKRISVVERYKEMNEALWKNLRSHGVTKISEKIEITDNPPNFSQNPKNWNR